ncbi:hypothetical protein CGRA01v4_11722 [Colletotrichum graminicola]|nr:hypothetical protein CGRA01v4_11722 [Colletotrichum graminicola]
MHRASTGGSRPFKMAPPPGRLAFPLAVVAAPSI